MTLHRRHGEQIAERELLGVVLTAFGAEAERRAATETGTVIERVRPSLRSPRGVLRLPNEPPKALSCEPKEDCFPKERWEPAWEPAKDVFLSTSAAEPSLRQEASSRPLVLLAANATSGAGADAIL